MVKVLEKVERRLGEKLFLKGDRCAGPKCAGTRRAFPPGSQGKKHRRGGRGRGGSEFGELMREKQKMRFFYGLDDGEIKRYVERASRETGVFRTNFLRMIERRLDVAVWRLGFAQSRRAARQIIGHGHLRVNGRAVSSPSYRVRPGEKIVMAQSAGKTNGEDQPARHAGALAPPRWLAADQNRREGMVVGLPEPDDLGLTFDVVKIKEFYSR